MPILAARSTAARGVGFGRILTTTAVDTGAMFAIGTIAVGAAGASSVTFTNIPATYAHLQLRATMRSSGSWHHTYLRVGNNGIDSGSNYSSQLMVSSGSSVITGEVYSSQTYLESAPVSNTANTFSVMVVDILDYASTNKAKTFRTLSGGYDNSTGYIFINGGLWTSTSAITNVSFINSNNSNTINQYSRFDLYGIKSA